MRSSFCDFWKHFHADSFQSYTSIIWKQKQKSDNLQNISPNYHALKADSLSSL